MFKNILFIFLIISSFIGCNSSSQNIDIKNSKPAWILNPNLNGKKGALGISGRTYDQKISTQGKRAIARALDELSLQMGVKVDIEMTTKEEVLSNNNSSSFKQNSNYKASNKVTAHIEGVYMDKYTNELYVWMVLD